MRNSPGEECSLSWNKVSYYEDDSLLLYFGDEYNEGVTPFRWGRIPPEFYSQIRDVVAVDNAISFLDDAEEGTATCGKPFFMALGIRRPHFPLFSPEEYFLDYYQETIYEEPYHFPYNYP